MGFGPRFEIPHRIRGCPVVITMRPARDGDAEGLASLRAGYATQQFVFARGGKCVKDEEEFLEQARVSRNEILWVVGLERENEAESIAGITRLASHRGNRFRSFTLLSNRALWNCGIATATHKLRTWYAFSELGANALNSSYIEHNVGSHKALERVGYVEIGRNWRAHLTGGQWRDEVLVACYNPASLALLWPSGDVPILVANAVSKTEAALVYAREVIRPQ